MYIKHGTFLNGNMVNYFQIEPFFIHTYVTCSELPSYNSNMTL